jgi:NADH-quinone oxidoreductase subunit G
MSDFKAVLDGTEVRGHEGMTILEAAEQVGIHIPTLCYSPDLTPEGNCRICVVEVKGSPRLVASCHTPIADGMVIHTHSPKVLAARKAILELLLTGHTGPCVTDECAKDCELHNLAAELEVGPPRFQVKKRRFYPVEEISPYVQRDMSRCILCRRCVRACVEIAKKNVFSVAYRGFKSKVVVDCDGVLDKEVCKDCGICIEYCPTSALTKPTEGVV